MIYRTIELELEGSPDDVIARLRGMTTPRRWTRQRYLAGKVKDNRFKMSLVHPLLGTATTPVIQGSIDETLGATRIRARVRPAAVVTFSVCAFGLLVLILPVILLMQERAQDAAVIIGVLGPLVLLLMLIHSRNAPYAMRLLQEAVKGAS